MARTGISDPRSKTRPAASASPASSPPASASTARRSIVSRARPAGRTRWNGSPSTASNTVRSGACRSTTSFSAASSTAASSRGRRERTTVGTLYAALPPSSCDSSHSRFCAYDAGTSSPSPSPGTGAGRAVVPAVSPPRSVISSASPATVGRPKTSRIVSRTPSASAMRFVSRAASRE
ncbi:hypothetical protein GCM10019017_19240 [Streptomyces showdoensis]